MADWLEIVVQILCGIALLAIIWWKLKPIYQFKKRSLKTEGTIINWMQTRSKEKHFFYPMIEFQTNKGRTIKFKAEERSENKPMFEVGTKVTVLYDPENPDRKKVEYPKEK